MISLRSSTSKHLPSPRINIKFVKRSFSAINQHSWNSLLAGVCPIGLVTSKRHISIFSTWLTIAGYFFFVLVVIGYFVFIMLLCDDWCLITCPVISIIIIFLCSLAQSCRLKIVCRKIVCLKLLREGTKECDRVASLNGYWYLLKQVACLIWITNHLDPSVSDLL